MPTVVLYGFDKESGCRITKNIITRSASKPYKDQLEVRRDETSLDNSAQFVDIERDWNENDKALLPVLRDLGLTIREIRTRELTRGIKTV